MKKSYEREEKIIKTGIIGVVTNLALAFLKIMIGLLANSLTLVLDAVNNTSDVLSSLVTIVGAKVGAKRPDKEHPLGHGRSEYIAAFLISGFIFYAGIASFVESVKRIIYPLTPEYSYITLCIIVLAIITKISLAYYVRKVGIATGSESLKAAGDDAFNDALVSGGTLVAGISNILFSWTFVEGYLGLLISIFYINTGVQALRANTSMLLGERVKLEIAASVQKIIENVQGVLGAYDLTFTDNGPGKLQASVRIEVDNSMCAREIDDLSRRIEKNVYEATGIPVMAVGIYALCQNDRELQKQISKIILNYPAVLQVHGFRISDKQLRCDIVISLSEKNREQIFAQIKEDLGKRYPKYELNLTLDGDISDIL